MYLLYNFLNLYMQICTFGDSRLIGTKYSSPDASQLIRIHFIWVTGFCNNPEKITSFSFSVQKTNVTESEDYSALHIIMLPFPFLKL
jgi:hypothetical protein